MLNLPRAILAFALLVAFALPLVLIQAVAIHASPSLSKRIPMWINRALLKTLGVETHVTGDVANRRPLILVANHVSWLDIPLLAAIAPVRFVSKAEVASWPVIGWLARLARSVFIERGNHGTVSEKAAEVVAALRAGDLVVIFPEGTTSDGNRVLYFKSGLLGAVREAMGNEELWVQPISILHTHSSGLPLGRAYRNHAAYPGGVRLVDSIGRVLREAALDIAVDFGTPVAYAPGTQRKDFAAKMEATVRRMMGDRLSDTREAARRTHQAGAFAPPASTSGDATPSPIGRASGDATAKAG